MKILKPATWWTLVALLMLATAWSIRPVSDIDVQWHLKIGAWMLDNHQVVRDDFYSVSKAGREWISVPWLYQCVLTWLLRHLGWAGPMLWQWLAALAITVQATLLMAVLQRHEQTAWTWPRLSLPAALAGLHVLALAELRFQHRPEMSTHVFLGLFLLLLCLRAQTDEAAWGGTRPRGLGEKQRQWIWVLVPLQALWANLHGVFALGPILVWTFVGAAWLSATLRGELKRRTRELSGFTLLGLAVLGACFVSPYGARTALYPLHLLYVLNDPAYKYGITEAIPISLAEMWRAGGINILILAVWTVAALGLAARLGGTARAGLLRRRAGGPAFPDEREIAYPIVCCGLFCITLTAVRNLPLFSIVGAPLVADGLLAILGGLAWLAGQGYQLRRGLWPRAGGASRWRMGLVVSRRRLGSLLLAALFAFLYQAVVSERYYEWMHRTTRFGIGQSDHEFPLAACDFLAEQLPRMANMAMLGDTKSADLFLNRFGPEHKTYIDGRHGEIYDTPFFSRYGETLGRRGVFFSEAGRLGVGLAMFTVADMSLGDGGLQKDIYRHPGWALIHLDDSGVVFAARVPANREVIERFALPPAPAAMDEQDRVYRQWLVATGRSEYTLFDPRNRNMSDTLPARLLTETMRLGGLLAPLPKRMLWKRSRVAMFLSALGWPAVADNIYEELMTGPVVHPAVAEEAINHALACFEACATEAGRDFYLQRLKARSRRLLEEDRDSVLALYGLAFADLQEGRPEAALERLRHLGRQRDDVVVLDMIARAESEIGDRAATVEAKKRQWRHAVRSWRLRLTRYPEGPGTFRAYLRLGDLFTRLQQPLEARANYVLALNEPDIPPLLAERAREHLRRLEMELFGVTFVPTAGLAPDPANPFTPPADMLGSYPRPALPGALPTSSRPAPLPGRPLEEGRDHEAARPEQAPR